MKKTIQDYANAVYAACDGDYIDSIAEISDLQHKLIDALAWHNCAPADGWYAVGNRQIEQLAACSTVEMDAVAATDWYALPADERPEEVIADIRKRMTDRRPWDVDAVDTYIAEHTA